MPKKSNGSMSTNTKGEGAIRQKMVENDLVDCMIALPGQLFYSVQIPVCLWFLTKSKKADSERGLPGSQTGYRNREGEILFIDARSGLLHTQLKGRGTRAIDFAAHPIVNSANQCQAA
jgi:type I restriction-modification system DNA methylase subunit